MSAVDMSQTIVPKSDQLNAEDLLSGPRTVTITEVRRGSAEQPVDIVLDEFGPGRPFKPCKTVRRVLVAAWGVNAAAYVGHRMTIYRDPAVKFGGMDVGGIRISHLSHIDKRITVALTVTRGKRAPYVVEPLTTPAAKPNEMINPDQMAKLQILFKERGILDRDERLAEVADIIGREVTSANELTKREASKVIDRLTPLPEPPVSDEPEAAS